MAEWLERASPSSRAVGARDVRKAYRFTRSSVLSCTIRGFLDHGKARHRAIFLLAFYVFSPRASVLDHRRR